MFVVYRISIFQCTFELGVNCVNVRLCRGTVKRLYFHQVFSSDVGPKNSSGNELLVEYVLCMIDALLLGDCCKPL